MKDTNPKSKFDAVKPPMGFIPASALIQEAVVFALGARKYDPYNWRRDPVSSMTYVHAALRHIYAWLDGQDNDPESTASHLANARAGLGILIDAAACGTLIDNRPPPGKAAELLSIFTEIEKARQAEVAAVEDAQCAIHSGPFAEPMP